eukprot:CAMPEP_0169152378 /NCGR_PEP_ID=MMETSP1015-20121227/51472_1 /TAXON_ID=342587 /ORGANISM="Karlodinium micrum, Strain CCMP2283" /LENGTH=101 /DNA_ID=CAMNT_0009222149 /DNA_START=45 /DNA_END=347 /DNA_ORIENTATION=+
MSIHSFPATLKQIGLDEKNQNSNSIEKCQASDKHTIVTRIKQLLVTHLIANPVLPWNGRGNHNLPEIWAFDVLRVDKIVSSMLPTGSLQNDGKYDAERWAP